MRGHMNEGTEEKDTGFPLTTGGNDRGGPAGMTGGTSRNDRDDRAGMTGETGGHDRGAAGLWPVGSGRHFLALGERQKWRVDRSFPMYAGSRQVLAA